jgi:hypothetical protein
MLTTTEKDFDSGSIFMLLLICKQRNPIPERAAVIFDLVGFGKTVRERLVEIWWLLRGGMPPRACVVKQSGLRSSRTKVRGIGDAHAKEPNWRYMGT